MIFALKRRVPAESIKIEHLKKSAGDSSGKKVHQNRKTLWIYRFQLFIYFIAFVFVVYVIYIDSESKIWVRLGIISVLVIPFLIISFKKIDSVLGKDFYMAREGEVIIINGKVRADKISINSVSVKEMISTRSAHGYYDIKIEANGKRYPVSLGVDENNKDKILEGLNYFFSK
jgi:hypothetical protein